MSLRIWSLVRLDSPLLCLFWVPLLRSLLTCIYMRLSDGNLVLVPLVSRGIDKNNTALVHAGFLISYNSVRAIVVHVVRDQLLAFPNYTVVISGSPPFFVFSAPWLMDGVGHSLGGALASLAALSVKSNIPSAAVRLFTYGTFSA